MFSDVQKIKCLIDFGVLFVESVLHWLLMRSGFDVGFILESMLHDSQHFLALIFQ